MTEAADKPSSIELEKTILRTILDAEGEAGGRLLAVLADRCQPPLHGWFAHRDCRLISLALDAAVRGEIQGDALAVSSLLGAIPFSDGVDAITGKRSWRKSPGINRSASVLAALGGGSWDDWPAISGSVAGFARNVELLRDMAERRRAIAVLRDTARKLQLADPRRSCADEIAVLAGNLASFAAGGREDTDSGSALAKAVAEGDDQRIRRERGEITIASWGLPMLDIECPLRPGGLYVLAGGPGDGKTSLALTAAAATAGTAHAGSVLFSTLEMRPGDLASILAGRTLGIGASVIRDGRLDPEAREHVDGLAATWRATGSLMLRDGSNGTTADSLCAWARARRTAAGGRLALVVIDYLQLLGSTDPRATEYQRLADATRRLKQLAIDLDAPVLLLSQLSRDGTKAARDRSGRTLGKPEPRLADLRGSGTIEQDADAVVALHRSNNEAEDIRPMRALLLKNRRGREGAIELMFDGPRQEFSEVPPRPIRSWANEPAPGEDAFAEGNQ